LPDGTATTDLSSPRPSPPITVATALSALGIVYGDLGTSPLYTMQAIVQAVGGHPTAQTSLGVLSLIFWALVITISIKYCALVMRADNHGEGGILALMALIGAKRLESRRILVIMGLFGAALIYGDGIITPAISVLSALEGVKVATPALTPFVLPAAVVILLLLFAVQRRGTARIGHLFGPIMLVWFVCIAALGTRGVIQHPSVLAAADPRCGLRLLIESRWSGVAVLGGVFLAITGGEALYADMGHFGRTPIRGAWYGIVLPALLLNYAGQTALLIQEPGVEGNPFFRLVPSWGVLPLVALAAAATIIASQAIITGSFSLTRQAIQLGWFPGLRIQQTSAESYGQIYVPVVNWVMMMLTVALAVVFGSSDRLAGAYGTAVSTTMLLTTALLYTVMRERWQWSFVAAVLVSSVFLVVDTGFFSANLLKITEGGWVPLTLGALVFTVMTTWRAGTDAVQRKHAALAEPLEVFLHRLRQDKVSRVPGTAVFITKTTDATPPLMLQHAAQMGAIQQILVALTIRFEEIPRVRLQDRVVVFQESEDFYRITVRYGFIEVPDLQNDLQQARAFGCPIDLSRAIFFAARDIVVPNQKKPALARWRVLLFGFLIRNAVRAVDLFHLPIDRFVEVDRQVAI
jgi:KUP system potassium uptake protein